MAKAKATDKYVNILNQSLTLSAANTLTFQEVNLGLNLFDKVGLLIHQIRIDLDNGTLRGLVASTDDVIMALTTSNQVSDLALSKQAVIDNFGLVAVANGTPGDTVIYREPFIMDYTMLPEKGILIAPKPLYLAGISSGLAAVATYNVRIMFTVVPLSGEDYFELLESRQFFG